MQSVIIKQDRKSTESILTPELTEKCLNISWRKKATERLKIK